MDILFNREIEDLKQGQIELKETLGFLSADFTYGNIEPDILLCTPDLVDFIGDGVYQKILQFYKGQTDPPPEDDALDKLERALKLCQLYILSMAYLDYASDNDLTHGNDGRSSRTEEDQEKPFEWQINKSNSSIKKRAYKALDQLMLLLDESEWTEWTGSGQYTAANSIFIKNTKEFDQVFPIHKSGQLYYRLVPFMTDFENDRVMPILGQTSFDSLKGAATPTPEEMELIRLIRKAVAHLSLGKALKAFPVEMFPDGIVHTEKSRAMSEARAEVMQFFDKEGENYLLKLEHEHAQQNQTFDNIELTPGLNDGEKYVSL